MVERFRSPFRWTESAGKGFIFQEVFVEANDESDRATCNFCKLWHKWSSLMLNYLTFNDNVIMSPGWVVKYDNVIMLPG